MLFPLVMPSLCQLPSPCSRSSRLRRVCTLGREAPGSRAVLTAGRRGGNTWVMVIAGPPPEVSPPPAARATVGPSLSLKSRRAESCEALGLRHRTRRLGRPEPGVPSILGQDAASTAGVGSAGGGRRARGGRTARPRPGCSVGGVGWFSSARPTTHRAWPAPPRCPHSRSFAGEGTSLPLSVTAS